MGNMTLRQCVGLLVSAVEKLDRAKGDHKDETEGAYEAFSAGYHQEEEAPPLKVLLKVAKAIAKDNARQAKDAAGQIHDVLALLEEAQE